MTRILALDMSGTPRQWISFEDAICYHAKAQVAWEFGSSTYEARGGYQKNGIQSRITTAPIIAIRAASGFAIEKVRKEVPLSNAILFARDEYRCAYCGREFHFKKLSRDHIIPRSRGGKDTWMNVVSACRSCNCAKDDQLLEECGMQLLYKPYVPCYSEKLLSGGYNILPEQREFLVSRLPKHSRMLNRKVNHAGAWT